MSGHHQVIYARSCGIPLASVFLEDTPAPPTRGRNWLDPELSLCRGESAVIYLGDADPDDTDLSFLSGLRVHLVGDEKQGMDRWSRWYEQLQAVQVDHLLASYNGEVLGWRALAS